MIYVKKSGIDRRKKLVVYGLTVFLLILLVSAVFFLTGGRGSKESETTSMIIKNQSEQNVVRATRQIQAGELADAVKFEVIAVPKELIPAGAVTSVQQLKNKRISNVIAEKEFLLQKDLVESAAWYEEGDRLIEHTFADGAVPITVEVGSIVDIKLFRTKSQDEVVIAKAVVVDKRDKTLSFYLNETEQEYIKEANTEGPLFLVQYLDKSQAASVISYIPSYDKTVSDFADSGMEKK